MPCLRNLLIPVLLVNGLIPLLGDTLVNTYGPFPWTDTCGEMMQVTVRVYADSDGLPGLYKWDYQVDNISVNISQPDPLLNGIGGIWIEFPGVFADLGNIYAPANWEIDTDGSTYLGVFSAYAPDPYIWWWDGAEEPIYSLWPGQTLHFGFTTFPRQAAILQPCDTSGSPCASASKIRRHKLFKAT